MAYLFDTDAISELLKPRPLVGYVEWIESVPRADQFTSAVVVAELYFGAYRSSVPARLVEKIERRVLPTVSVLPFDTGCAKVFGQLDAHLESAGLRLADADLQIGSTAVYHGLELVTGNVRHFSRIPGLTINRVLVEARESQRP